MEQRRPDNDMFRLLKINNFNDYDETRTAGRWQMPTLEPCSFVPERLLGYKRLYYTDKTDFGVHFFCYDNKFERIWEQPHLYIPKLAKYECVLTPDFSLYTDMPLAMKLWNVYRSRMIGQIMQNYGLNVIPTLQWAQRETFDFCFDGLPKHSVVVISTVGVKRSREAGTIWLEGAKEAVKRLKPSVIINYGGKMGYDYDGIKTVYIENDDKEIRKNGRKRSEQR